MGPQHRDNVGEEPLETGIVGEKGGSLRQGDGGRWQVGPELGGWWEIRGPLKSLGETGSGPVLPPV